MIGLIGDMSWESTVTYYQLINEAVKEKLGGLHSAKILLYSVDFAQIEQYQIWVHCPVCGNKTRLRLREDTVLTHFPLFCPKCKKESLIDAKEYIVKEIK